MVTIEDEFQYAHLAPMALGGTTVQFGVSFATISNTGTGAFGCHLHLEYFPELDQDEEKNPLLKFPQIADESKGDFNMLLLRQGTSTRTLISGRVYNFTGPTELLVLGGDAGNYGGLKPNNWFRTYSILDEGRPLAADYAFSRFPGSDWWPEAVSTVYSTSNPATVISTATSQYDFWYRMGELDLEVGSRQVCVYGEQISRAQARLSASICRIFDVSGDVPRKQLKRSNGSLIPSGGATNETEVVVYGESENGLERFVLSGPTTGQIPVSGTASTQTFSGLTPGATYPYTVYVYDSVGNVTSGEFRISTAPPSTPSARSLADIPQTSYVESGTNLRFIAQDPSAGICMMTHGSQVTTATFNGPPVATWGPLEGIAQGTHTVTAYNCAGSSNSFSYFYSTASVDSMKICASSTTQVCTTRTPNGETILNGTLTVEIDVGDPCPTGWDERVSLTVDGLPANQFDSANCRAWRVIPAPAHSINFEARNSSTVDMGVPFAFVGIVKFVNEHRADLGFAAGALNAGNVVVGTVTIADVGQDYPSGSSSGTMSGPFKGTQVSSTNCSSPWTLARRQGLAALGECWYPHGSDFLLTTEATMTIVAQDTGSLPAVDTTTIKIFQWTGSSWSINGLTQLSASKSTTTGIVTVIATLSRSATYSMLFSVVDTSAPATSGSIQGSSHGFGGTTFVSTYSYLVLSSTDPTVNGFASGLATTYYRIDGLPGDAFAAYSSSLSFLPGTHWVDYYAVDWAGNSEAVQRATITVTAGSVTKLSGDLQVDGNLLAGFLGSGAKAEVVARAEYDYALMVSSVDGRAMLAVDNANFASIGTAPASGRLTLAGISQDTALALRSGNSTASVTGAQLAFGFDGTGDLRHRLYTQHGSAANLNKLVFALWTPASGSSATLGNLPVLSLEGSTITAANALAHVMPAGVADKELVVSNGGGMGEGDVLRWDRWVPSAAILKKDIKRLGKADEEKAWADLAALRPIEFRRKTAPPGSPLERGYIFEEIPQSIRDGPGAASVDERLVNAELALKAAMRRIAELKARIKKVKEGRR